MSFLKSLFFNHKGTYDIFGTKVIFRDFPCEKKKTTSVFNYKMIPSFNNLFSLCHEMGHCIAAQTAGYKDTSVIFVTNYEETELPGSARCDYSNPSRQISNSDLVMINILGPLYHLYLSRLILGGILLLPISLPVMYVLAIVPASQCIQASLDICVPLEKNGGRTDGRNIYDISTLVWLVSSTLMIFHTVEFFVSFGKAINKKMQ